MFIHPIQNDSISGFHHIYIHNGDVLFVPHPEPIIGILEVTSVISLWCSYTPQHKLIRLLTDNEKVDGSIAYDNYIQDCTFYEHFGCSYEHYIANLIDKLLKVLEHNVDPLELPAIDTNDVTLDSNNTDTQIIVPPSIEAIIGSLGSKNFADTQDFNIRNKYRGFLNHGPKKFSHRPR